MIGIFSLSELILYFLIYSFFGWVLEILYVSYHSKKFVNRGFLFGPFCPIYGFGVLLFLILLQPIYNYPLLFFIGAIIVTSSVEYLTGFIFEKFFKTTLWDYSNENYNLHGRICLRISIYWGFLSTFFFYFIQPNITQFVSFILSKSSIYLPIIILLYFITDFVITLISFFNLKKIFNNIELLKEKYLDDLENFNKEQKTVYTNFKKSHRRLFKAFPKIKLVK